MFINEWMEFTELKPGISGCGIGLAAQRRMMRQWSFLKTGHLATLFSAFLYFDVSFMVWVLLGAVGNYVAADFGLTPLQKGFMTAVPLLGGSILRLVFGHLSDTIVAQRT